MSTSSIENTILNDNAQISDGKDIFSDTNAVGNSRAFVDAIHYKAIAPAFNWTSNYQLGNYNRFIDIGGGSGVHAIAACIRNDNLKATICDRKPVLTHTNRTPAKSSQGRQSSDFGFQFQRNKGSDTYKVPNFEQSNGLCRDPATRASSNTTGFESTRNVYSMGSRLSSWGIDG